MKIKSIFWGIFIYILLTGCADTLDDCHSDYYLEIDAPSLEKDSGYYELEFLPDYIQTFTTLEAQTGADNNYEKLKWISNKEIHMGYGEWANLVNGDSYTDENGRARTVLGVWETFVGDTITVYAGYTDKCDIQYIDSLKVVIDG